MLAYTTLGVTDFERANAFYAELLSVIDAGHVLGNERIALYGTDVQNPMLAICIPYDEKAPTAGNGTMVSIRTGSRAACDEFYAKAFALAPTCDGPPGKRMPAYL